MENGNHVGETYGIYTLTEFLNKKDKYNHYLYKGKCKVCGYEIVKPFNHFSAPTAIANNCRHLDRNGNYRNFNKFTWDNKRIGSIFHGIKSRCYNKNDKSYRWYGEKGIKIYKEWIDNPKSFEIWALSNGYKDDLTIDRIDENKDYCPENCRWIPSIDNSKYKSTTSLIEVNEEIHSGKDWAKILGFNQNLINNYIRKYGLENTIEFIKKYQANPILEPKNNQSYYDLYMS